MIRGRRWAIMSLYFNNATISRGKIIRYLRREGLIELDGYSIAGGLPKHLLE